MLRIEIVIPHAPPPPRVCAVCAVGHPNFNFFQGDVTEPFYIEVDQVYHLACPASPPRYAPAPAPPCNARPRTAPRDLALPLGVWTRIVIRMPRNKRADDAL